MQWVSKFQNINQSAAYLTSQLTIGSNFHSLLFQFEGVFTLNSFFPIITSSNTYSNAEHITLLHVDK